MYLLAKTRMTWNLILKFFPLLILVVEALYLMNPTDATLASLSVLKYSTWRPKWPSVRLLRPVSPTYSIKSILILMDVSEAKCYNQLKWNIILIQKVELLKMTSKMAAS